MHSALLAARHVLGADVAIVAQGPGNLGTGTTWGFSGTAVGEAVNAAVALGGQPVGSLRISDADGRDRHRGISHHSMTAYGRVALAAADLVVPARPPGTAGERGRGAGRDAAVTASDRAGRHRRTRRRRCVPLPVKLSTMGRDLDGDYAYFLAAAAAGRHAAALI